MAARASAPHHAATGDIPLAVGDVIEGKYKVERVVGAGGVGVVFAAEHLLLGGHVAIKLLQRTARSEENVTRFDREARALARIKSEHVARIMDVGALGTGEPYMVMELLAGEDFASVLRTHGKVPVAEAVEYVVQACEAVALAHDVGIVHRDLKPANLFLTRGQDGSPVVKVLDFGISKLRAIDPEEQAVTRTLSVIGSPLYMSPEQMESPKDADERADVWSLGVIAYELIAGKPPFEAPTFPLLCARICTAEPTPIEQHEPSVPPALFAVLSRCLKKKPSERYASVASLARALAAFGGASAKQRAARIVKMVPAGVEVAEPAAEDRDADSSSPESLATKRLAWDSSPPPPLAAPAVKTRSRASWLVLGALAAVAFVAFLSLRTPREPQGSVVRYTENILLKARVAREITLREDAQRRAEEEAASHTQALSAEAAPAPDPAPTASASTHVPSARPSPPRAPVGPKRPPVPPPVRAEDVLNER